MRQRSERISPTYVRNYNQLKHSDRRELDVKVIRLAGCALGTEVPLLPNDFPVRLSAIRRPTQDVLLCALSAGLHEVQPDPPKPLRLAREAESSAFRDPARHPEAEPDPAAMRSIG